MYYMPKSKSGCPCEEGLKSDGGGAPLCRVKSGCKVKVACVEGGRKLCARMAALGIYPGVEMQLLCNGCGFPCMVRINGGTLSLGDGISEKIFVTPSA
jgi:ferrous iron transport protein A